MDNYIQRIGLLFLRIFVGGTMLLAHGVPKLLDPKPFIEALSSNGFPLPNIMAYLSISAEAIFPVFIIQETEPGAEDEPDEDDQKEDRRETAGKRQQMVDQTQRRIQSDQGSKRGGGG